jgi:hypothetical protein
VISCLYACSYLCLTYKLLLIIRTAWIVSLRSHLVSSKDFLCHNLDISSWSSLLSIKISWQMAYDRRLLGFILYSNFFYPIFIIILHINLFAVHWFVLRRFLLSQYKSTIQVYDSLAQYDGWGMVFNVFLKRFRTVNHFHIHFIPVKNVLKVSLT